MWGPQSRDRIKNTRTLIVDEVSMISGDFFTQLEQQCRKIRGREQAFGGIQVVVTGDFLQVRAHARLCSAAAGAGHSLPGTHGCVTRACTHGRVTRACDQLPPVPTRKPAKLQRLKSGEIKEPFLNRGLAFQSAGWAACKFTTVLLTQIMRQQVRLRYPHADDTHGRVAWLSH